MSTRTGRAAALATAVALLATGCGIGGLYGVPLPGGPDTGEHPYHVVAYFRDVLDLVPQATVKVNDVGVGKIERIEPVEIDGAYAAKVSMVVNASAVLPADAEAAVRQTSLLGEKFIELRAPATQIQGAQTQGAQTQGARPRDRLSEGAEIPLERTQRNVEVEEVLGALSMLLNGGGVEQIQSIVGEVNAALDGNEPELRSLLSDLDTFFAGLDAQHNEIARAIEGLNTLSVTLDGQHDQLTTALDGLEPGLAVLDEQRAQLVGMLQALQRLGGVATDVINRSRDDVLADLRALQPVLTELARAGGNLPKALELLLTFPFPDNAVDAIKGDYANLDLKMDLDLREVISNLGVARQPQAPALPGAPPTGLVPLLPGLPGWPPLPPLPPLPAQPTLPGLPGGGQGDQQGGSGGTIFDDLLGLTGGGRP